MNRTREIWIDNTKVTACVLVVLGHFFQGIVKAGILPNNGLYQWFNQTIYCFHVPLFFICSGYLYQKYSLVDSIARWKRNGLKKLISLGIPYVFFTVAVCLIKTLIPGAGEKLRYGLLTTLLVRPMSPYWYLYCLFFLFLLIPTCRNIHMMYGYLVVTLVGKLVSMLPGADGLLPYSVYVLLGNGIWFAGGMAMCFFRAEPVQKHMVLPAVGSVLFLGASVLLRIPIRESEMAAFIMGIWGSLCVLALFAAMDQRRLQSKWMVWLAQYTIPVYLMHSIFAATLRSVLMKLGITQAWIHIPAGLIAAFLAPVFAAEVMRKLKYPEFFLYPGKFIKIK